MLSLVACLSLHRGKGDGNVISRVPPVTAGWSCVSASSNPLPSFFKQANMSTYACFIQGNFQPSV